MAKRVLQIWSDGKQGERLLEMPLQDGEQGNLQTLGYMIRFVQRDRLKADLRRLVLQLIKGVKGHDSKNEVKRVFDYAQKKIVYRRDAVQVERVCDMWTTIFGLENDKDYQPEGDCGIKAVFLATALALIGYKPFFVVIKQDKDSPSFNHIYNAVVIDGKTFWLDATPEDKPQGYEPFAYEKYLVPIF